MRNFQREEDQMQAVPMGYMAQPFIQSNVNVVSQPMANLNQCLSWSRSRGMGGKLCNII